MLGKFIVVEGVDTSGKDTIISRIKTYLESRGKTVYITREPGDGMKELRKLLKTKRILPLSEMLLFMADRHEHVNKVIAPQLEKGIWVISNRYTYSSVVYQGSKGVDKELIEHLNYITTGGLEPDLVIFLETTPEIIKRRLKMREQNGEYDKHENPVFLEMLNDKYKQIFKTMDNNVLFVPAVSADGKELSVEDKMQYITCVLKLWFLGIPLKQILASIHSIPIETIWEHIKQGQCKALVEKHTKQITQDIYVTNNENTKEQKPNSQQTNNQIVENITHITNQLYETYSGYFVKRNQKYMFVEYLDFLKKLPVLLESWSTGKASIKEQQKAIRMLFDYAVMDIIRQQKFDDIKMFNLLTPSSIMIMGSMLNDCDIRKILHEVSYEGRFLEHMTVDEFKEVISKFLEMLLIHYLMYMPTSYDEYIQLVNDDNDSVICIENMKIKEILLTYAYIDKLTPAQLVDELVSIVTTCHPIRIPIQTFKDVWEQLVYDTYKYLSKHVDVSKLQTTKIGEPVSASAVLKHIQNVINYLAFSQKEQVDTPTQVVIKTFIKNNMPDYEKSRYGKIMWDFLWEIDSIPVHYGEARRLDEIDTFVVDWVNDWIHKETHKQTNKRKIYPLSILFIDVNNNNKDIGNKFGEKK